MPTSPETFEVARLYDDFQAVVTRLPHQTAIVAAEGSRTYAELGTDVETLAAGLTAQGISAGDRVTILLHRGIDAVSSLLACIRIGATSVALDPAFPEARLLSILDDCRPSIVIAHEECRQLLTTYPGKVCSTEQLKVSDGALTVAVATQPAATDPMYIIYTSGSTGRPKGIVQTFRTIQNLIAWQNSATGITFSGRVLHNSSLAFDVCWQEILSTLTQGGTLVISSEDERIDPELLLNLLTEQHINVVYLSVSTLTRILGTAERLRRLPGSLTDIVTAGEQLYVSEHLRRYLITHPRVRLHNHYGVSESHVVTAYVVHGGMVDLPTKVPIGKAVAGAGVQLMQPDGNPPEVGGSAEIVISGPCLALGYLNRPDEQAKRFVDIHGTPHYRTGDIARQLPSGDLEFLGRADLQLKVRGHLVEPGEIEAVLATHRQIGECAAGLVRAGDDETHLAVWYTTTDPSCTTQSLREHLRTYLPAFMVPSRFFEVESLPTGATGKVDRQALSELMDTAANDDRATPSDDSTPEQAVLSALRNSLGNPQMDARTHFFDAGATSLTLVNAAEALTKLLGTEVSTVDLFRHPTAADLSAAIERRQRTDATGPSKVARATARTGTANEAIAIVGMAAQFPGAPDIHSLWTMLAEGRHGLRPLVGASATSHWMPAVERPPGPSMVGLLEDAYGFDADFFGYSAREAAWTDPQQRLLLMCAYSALEAAGINPDQDRNIGVFAGSEFPGYIANVRPEIQTLSDYLQALIGNDKDFLATRVAHKLNLTGPAISVQTACSTSLVAVHLARQALLSGDCDVALAGGVSLQSPQEYGHAYEQGLIYSPDGFTRPFDADGAGTNITNGVGIVVLKRLSDAIASDDNILAVIRGSAINNDGSDKVGYTAPSISGQTRVLRSALQSAAITPDDIDFIEAHGTATPIGDTMEISALAEVFHPTERTVYLGSIKGNVGHTNRASGIAGLIKAVLALRHQCIPATVGHRTPTPALEHTPFAVPVTAINLPDRDRPYRAGVSSFGFGGTNAHVIVEQWPKSPTKPTADQPSLVSLTAHHPDQLGTVASQLADHIETQSQLRLADIAYTHNVCRQTKRFAATVVARNRGHLITQLRDLAAEPATLEPPAQRPQLVFLMPGGGRSLGHVGPSLYRRYSAFRQSFDDACLHLNAENAKALRLWITAAYGTTDADERAELMQPLVLILSIATSALLKDWAVTPDVVVGSSLGEFSALAVAGAINLSDVVPLVEERGRLEDTCAPEGAMLSAELSWTAAQSIDVGGCELAGHNSRNHVLFSGKPNAIDELERRLQASEIVCKRLPNQRPNHTTLMSAAARALDPMLRAALWNEPTIPVVSTVDGQHLRLADLKDPQRWIEHCTGPIRFAEALERSGAASRPTIFLEVGPSAGLAGLAQFHCDAAPDVLALSTLPRQGDDEQERMLSTIAELVLRGVGVDVSRVQRDDGGRPTPLPTYPFRLTRFALPSPDPGRAERSRLTVRRWQQWLHTIYWQDTVLTIDPVLQAATWLIIGHDGQHRDAIVQHLTDIGMRAIGSDHDNGRLERAFHAVANEPGKPVSIVYLAEPVAVTSPADAILADATRSAIYLHHALKHAVRLVDRSQVTLLVASTGHYRHGDTTGPSPLTTALIVACQEHPGLRAAHVDHDSALLDPAVVVAETNNITNLVVAYRGGNRHIGRYGRTPSKRSATAQASVAGAVLITGGLGAVGMKVAEHLAAQMTPMLIVGRTEPDADIVQAKLQRLRQTGAQVCYQQADVCDSDQVTRAIAVGEGQLGPLAAVIHAAADLQGDEFLGLIETADPNAFARQLAPKVGGLICLEHLLDERSLAYRCAFSSNSVWLGGLGYAPYAVANAAMGQLAAIYNAHRPEQPWIVIDWDVWDGTAEAGAWVPLTTSVAAHRMPTADALACLDHLVSTRDRALISCTDLDERLDLIADLLTSDRGTPTTNDAAKADVTDPYDIAADAWRRALHAPVEAASNFLDLGGDSLTAIKVVLEVNRRTGSTLTAQDMLQAGDLSDFVARVRASIGGPLNVAEPAITTPRSEDSNTVTSFLQERWFAMAQRGYGHIELSVEIRGPVDPEMMRRAISHLSTRHEVLRSTYQPGASLQKMIDASFTPSVHVTDATTKTSQDVTAAILEAKGRAKRRFDLTKEVPFEVELVRTAPDTLLMVGRIHHIAIDGWSFSLLIEDLERVYAEMESGGDPLALPSPPQYSDFATNQRRYVDDGGITGAREFWRSHFHGATGPTRLPQAKPLPQTADDPEAGACVNVVVPADLAAKVAHTAHQNRTTAFSVLVAAFASMVRNVAEQDDLIIGTTAAGRHLPGSEEMVGVFVNPLPLRINLSGRVRSSEVLTEVTNRLSQFHQHQNYLLADLIEHVPPFVDTDINECFHTYILFQNYPKPDTRGPRSYTVGESDDMAEAARMREPHAKLMREFELVIVERSDGALSLNFWYRIGRFTEAQVRQWAELFVVRLHEQVGS